MNTPLVSIVVPNLNGAMHLTGLLPCLGQQSLRDFELILVDNGSTDGSVERVRTLGARHHIETTVIGNATNLGFAKPCNQGMRVARGEWIAMLNNDTQPEPQWLAALLAAAEAAGGPAQKIGMVGSKMLMVRRANTIDSAGIALDRAGIAWDWRGGERDDPAERDLVEIFGPCGGAALYHRSLMQQLAGFDEDFFAYHEDVDFAWRARLLGWRGVLAPQARVLHVHSATLGEASPRKRFLLARNKVWTLLKNYPARQIEHALHAALATGYDAAATAYGIVHGGDVASARGRVAALRQLPRFWAKRRHICPASRHVDNCWRLMQPVEPLWRVPQRYAHLAESP